MDRWLAPMIVCAYILLETAMQQNTQTSAWDKALGTEQRFTLMVLARLTQGKILQTNPKNPVRSRMILTSLSELGLAEEAEPHSWRPTFLGRRVARMLNLEQRHAANPT